MKRANRDASPSKKKGSFDGNLLPLIKEQNDWLVTQEDGKYWKEYGQLGFYCVRVKLYNDSEAIEWIKKINRGLMLKAVEGIFLPHWELEDTLSYACIGLLAAVRTFDPRKGYTFSTWAFPLMHNEVRKAFMIETYEMRNPSKEAFSLDQRVHPNSPESTLTFGDLLRFKVDKYRWQAEIVDELRELVLWGSIADLQEVGLSLRQAQAVFGVRKGLGCREIALILHQTDLLEEYLQDEARLGKETKCLLLEEARMSEEEREIVLRLRRVLIESLRKARKKLSALKKQIEQEENLVERVPKVV